MNCFQRNRLPRLRLGSTWWRCRNAGRITPTYTTWWGTTFLFIFDGRKPTRLDEIGEIDLPPSRAAAVRIEGVRQKFAGFCSIYQDHVLRNLPCKLVQADEIWSFCGAKQKNARPGAARESQMATSSAPGLVKRVS